jgi:hypothetical protein
VPRIRATDNAASHLPDLDVIFSLVRQPCPDVQTSLDVAHWRL